MNRTAVLSLLFCLAAPAAGWLAGTGVGRALSEKPDRSPAEQRAPRPWNQRAGTAPEEPDTLAEVEAIARGRGPGRAAEALALCSRRGAAGLTAMLQAARDDPALTELLINTWEAQDPHMLVRVLANMNDLPQDGFPGMRLDRLVQSLARQDIDRALQTAAEIKSPATRRAVTGTMIAASMHEDPAKALALAERYPGSRIWADYSLDEIGPKLTPEMIPRLAALPRTIMQTDLLAAALRRLPPEEAWGHIGKLSGFVRKTAVLGYAEAWARDDLPAVMERAQDESLPLVLLR